MDPVLAILLWLFTTSIGLGVIVVADGWRRSLAMGRAARERSGESSPMQNE